MLEDYFNKEAISKMSFKEFEAIYKGSPTLAKFRISTKDAFKQLGGKMRKPKKKDKVEDLNTEGAE